MRDHDLSRYKYDYPPCQLAHQSSTRTVGTADAAWLPADLGLRGSCGPLELPSPLSGRDPETGGSLDAMRASSYLGLNHHIWCAKWAEVGRYYWTLVFRVLCEWPNRWNPSLLKLPCKPLFRSGRWCWFRNAHELSSRTYSRSYRCNIQRKLVLLIVTWIPSKKLTGACY